MPNRGAKARAFVREPWVVAAAVVALAAVASWFLLVPAPRLIAPSQSGADASDRLKAVSDARTAIVQLLGGGILGVGLVFTARTYYLSHRGQLTDRFSSAVEQLGDEKAVIRMGGVFALEQLGLDSKLYAQPSSDVLAALIREQCPIAAEDATPTPIEGSAQASLTVLARRRIRQGARRLELPGTSLRDAKFPRLAGLERANLSGADLTKADLTDCRLAGADLSNANLRAAIFFAADLTNADLRGASLNETKFYQANLSGAQIRRQDLASSRLTSSQIASMKIEE